MIHAVYIADTNNNLVFEYLTNLTSPNFKSLSNAIVQSQQTQLPTIEITSELFLVHEKTKNLTIYVLYSNKNRPNPLVPAVFIKRLLEVMSDYFGTPLALTKIDANSDTLTLLINEMLDDGIPYTTDFNKLRDSIPFKSLLSKLLSTPQELAAAGQASFGHGSELSSTASGSVSAPNSIPWRRSNVRYTNNEMYVDVVETLNVILKPSKVHKKTQLYSNNNHFDSAFYSSVKTSQRMVPISGGIQGSVNFRSHLTGIPLLQMVLSISGLNLQLPSFHRCIELEKWLANPGTMSFIPPDGKSELMSYEIDLDSVNKRDVNDMLGVVTVDFSTGLGSAQNEFEIKLIINNIKAVSKIENFKVVVHCDDDEDDDEKPNVTNIKSNRITHGDFTYQGNGKGEWNLRNINTGIQPLFQGTIFTSHTEETSSLDDSRSSTPNLIDGMESVSAKPIKPVYLELFFSYKGALPSGLKVDSLKVISAQGLGEAVKPYKGVKYITKSGEYIIRS